ncbi:MAG: lysoplasmalogenase [Actinomycetota bacterium]|nr:lysoplasmalogenase [Actinomycetota bacterium]
MTVPRHAAGRLLPFAVASGVHLAAKLAGTGRLDRASKAVLLPTLGIRLLGSRSHSRRRVALLVTEMTLSWIGDLTIDRSFRTGLAAFLAAHLCMIALFWSGFRTRMSPWSVLLLPWLVVMMVVLRPPRLTALYPAVVAYATVLAAMAASAGRGGRRMGAGGILFVVSDSLLAFRQFTPWFRTRPWGAVVMASYLAAQLLLVDGVIGAPARQEARP